ncbi:MAG: hypothetical protein ACREPF_02350 [Rhodanobacteraceae bacterium]
MPIRLGSGLPLTMERLAERLHAAMVRLQPMLDALGDGGFVERGAGAVALTRRGHAVYARLLDARSRGLERLLRGWPPEQQAEMAGTIHSLAERPLSDDFADAMSAFRMSIPTAAGRGGPAAASGCADRQPQSR